MPLYICSKCNAVENTAPGQYWSQRYHARRGGENLKPVCSECYTGTWHGRFEKVIATEEEWEPDPIDPAFVRPARCKT